MNSPFRDSLTGSALSRRKCLLFAARVLGDDLSLIDGAMCRSKTDPPIWDSARHLDSLRGAIAVVDRAADEEANPEEENAARETWMQFIEIAVMNQDFEVAAYFRDIEVLLLRDPTPPNRSSYHSRVARVLSRGRLAGHSSFHPNVSGQNRVHEKQAIETRMMMYRQYLVDVFCPFPSLTFPPEWHTGTAVSLARTMYDTREFGAMPILADALQDAGCDNADILDHCRDTSLTHVRGCWLVDLVLGKQ